MFKTILVPIEVGNADQITNTINIAAKNGNEDTRIILLSVVEEIPKWAEIELPKGLQKKSFQYSHQALTDIAAASNVKTEVEVRVGHPYHTILEVAEETGAEMIVITSHKPGLQNYLLGSTAAKVVRHAKCSVMVLR